MRELGLALLISPMLFLMWSRSNKDQALGWAVHHSYSYVVRVLTPAKMHLEISVARRLKRLGVGAQISPDQFRRQQIRWASTALAIGGMIVVILGQGATQSIVVLISSAACGAFLRDRQLSAQVKRHEFQIAARFPQAAELLALAVSAGESPVAALDRLVARGKGPLIAEFSSAIGLMNAGVPLAVALDEISRQSGVAALRRFIDGVIVTLERGTPIAETLRMQANDAREEQRRALLEASGRAEIAMMIPIVFLVMPITVLFALWPSIVALSSMTYK
ncbi:MAG TPA: type II secretion system F family protein [Candidatus Nanopelagicaceae bacterium]|nr:type II secretion system F family protein [Candidatus Nanopelagicaceae bacterium]